MLTTHNPTKIAALNDAARKSFSGCRVYMTPGVQALYGEALAFYKKLFKFQYPVKCDFILCLCEAKLNV